MPGAYVRYRIKTSLKAFMSRPHNIVACLITLQHNNSKTFGHMGGNVRMLQPRSMRIYCNVLNPFCRGVQHVQCVGKLFEPNGILRLRQTHLSWLLKVMVLKFLAIYGKMLSFSSCCPLLFFSHLLYCSADILAPIILYIHAWHCCYSLVHHAYCKYAAL